MCIYHISHFGNGGASASSSEIEHIEHNDEGAMKWSRGVRFCCLRFCLVCR